MTKTSINILIILGGLISCMNPNRKQQALDFTENKNPTNKVVLSSEIVWEKLNPARGEQSPQAGTIWGDRKGEIATGFLAKFTDGFSSPPHIHNVTYRAVVIKGMIHNDDPKAENMWMKTGSFWTQPVGESHIMILPLYRTKILFFFFFNCLFSLFFGSVKASDLWEEF
ncbi:uncharacterized protein DUF4437, partial [Dyadobacter jejuensis]